jgi:hypothetical protein
MIQTVNPKQIKHNDYTIGHHLDKEKFRLCLLDIIGDNNVWKNISIYIWRCNIHSPDKEKTWYIFIYFLAELEIANIDYKKSGKTIFLRQKKKKKKENLWEK